MYGSWDMLCDRWMEKVTYRGEVGAPPKNEHTYISIGKSKFAELRPKYVLYSSDLPQNVFTCIYNENVMLILQALHHIDSIYPLYSQDLPNKFVCF